MCAWRKEWAGKRFGRLVVIADDEPPGAGRQRRKVLCRCDCGKEKRIILHNLIVSNTVSWATRSMQARNKRPTLKQPVNRFRGVYKASKSTFCFKICVNNRIVWRAGFIDEISAAKAYDKAAVRYHGSNAVTNAMLGRL